MSENEGNAKNTVVGEFLLSVARAPESIQEAVIINAIKTMMPFYKHQIEPYPMLSHLVEILRKQGLLEDESEKKESA